MVSFPSPPFRVALFGAGRVGTAVAMHLLLGGHEIVGVASRTPGSAMNGARRLRTKVVSEGERVDANVFLIGAAGPAVGSVAQQLAATQTLADAVVCHFSGSDGTGILKDVVEAGASACAIHPVQACPDVDSAIERLPGSAWGVTTTQGVEEWTDRLIAFWLSGSPVRVAEEVRPVWHAAAVITSNGIAALMAAGEEILTDVGIADPHRILGPLAIGTAANAFEGGGGGATLTGPVVRGEVESVTAHLDALAAVSRSHADAYRATSRLVLEAAVRNGRVDAATAERIAVELR